MSKAPILSNGLVCRGVMVCQPVYLEFIFQVFTLALAGWEFIIIEDMLLDCDYCSRKYGPWNRTYPNKSRNWDRQKWNWKSACRSSYQTSELVCMEASRYACLGIAPFSITTTKESSRESRSRPSTDTFHIWLFFFFFHSWLLKFMPITDLFSGFSLTDGMCYAVGLRKL